MYTRIAGYDSKPMCLHMCVSVFLLLHLNQNVTLKLIPLSNVKEASLTKTYVYWTETDLTIQSSTLRSLKCTCYCTFVHSQPTACNITECLVISHSYAINMIILTVTKKLTACSKVQHQQIIFTH